MNIIFTILIIVFVVSCAIGGAIELFGSRNKEEGVDMGTFGSESKDTIDAFIEFGKTAKDLSLPKKKTVVTYNCVNCGAPIKSNHCEYCGTEYK